jgi:hypothetical protein
MNIQELKELKTDSKEHALFNNAVETGNPDFLADMVMSLCGNTNPAASEKMKADFRAWDDVSKKMGN